MDPAFARSFQMATLGGPVNGAFIDAAVAERLRLPAAVWRGVLRALLDDDHTDRLREIVARTLIIWGDRDVFGDRAQEERLVRAIPDAHFVIQAGVGHAPHWENPARVAAEITAFLGLRSARAA